MKLHQSAWALLPWTSSRRAISTAPSLLERCAAVPRVPTHLIHARNDRICPPDGALALQQRLPHATLQWLDGAGHDAGHPAMVAAVMTALASYADQGSFGDRA